MPEHVLLSAEALRRFVAEVCAAAGCDAVEAEAIAEHLVEANLTGHDSHGLRALSEYVAAMLDGRLKLGQRVKAVRDAGAVLVLDGGLGVGQVVARQAMEMGIERAKVHGVALVALRNAHHLGRIGAWAELCAAAGCASVHFVNVIGHPPYVAPFGGRQARIATNPFCVGLAATGRPPVILDMATSKAAWGKLMVARNKGEPAPPDTLIDAAGRPSVDPGVLLADPPGSLLPMGEHKGYGLAVMCELMAGALGGGGTNQPEMALTLTSTNNMLSFIVAPGALGDVGAMALEADALVAWLKSTAPAKDFDEVLVPGEPEFRSRKEREANGIPIDRETWKEVLRTAASVGCAAPGPGAAPPQARRG